MALCRSCLSLLSFSNEPAYENLQTHLGGILEGGIAGIDQDLRQDRRHSPSRIEMTCQFLFDLVSNHPLRFGINDVQWHFFESGPLFVIRALQHQQSALWTVTVHERYVVPAGGGGEGGKINQIAQSIDELP